jgi:limonene 1,2-monooxygenase
VGFVHDWANIENTFRSWDMVARYVIPEINGYVTKLRESQKHLQDNRAVFDRAGAAIMAKIMENKDAAEALRVTTSPRVSAAAAQVPKGLGKQAAE